MTGHRPFSELTKRLPPARKARIDDKAAALNTALTLHELRKARTVSQQELASRLAVGQPAVAKLERRRHVCEQPAPLRRGARRHARNRRALSRRRGDDRARGAGGGEEEARVMTSLNALDRDIEIVIRKKPKSRPAARTRI